MTKLAALLLMLVAALSNAAELAVPKTFVNGEVADADDFNSNNTYLIEKISEEKTRIDELLTNARWKNALDHGAIIKKVDCTSNQSALIEAYHANAHEDHLQFNLTGSCFGAYRYMQEITEDGPSEIGQLQPKNQVVGLISDTTVDPSNRAKIVPRTLIADREYYVAGLVSSFGNGLYVTNIDIQMGADDNVGVLFSRSSNGSLTDVSIKGAAEPAVTQEGVRIQRGAAAYIGGSGDKAVIEDVAKGVVLRDQAMGFIYGSQKIFASVNGINQFLDGSLRLGLTGGGKISAPTAIELNGGKGLVYVDSSSLIDGDITLIDSELNISIAKFNPSATIYVQSSTLKIQSDDSGMTVDRVSCAGLNEVSIPNLSMSNNNGNGCLDIASWKTLIDSAFPVSSSSDGGTDAEPVISKQSRRANSFETPTGSNGGGLDQTTGDFNW